MGCMSAKTASPERKTPYIANINKLTEVIQDQQPHCRLRYCHFVHVLEIEKVTVLGIVTDAWEILNESVVATGCGIALLGFSIDEG